MFGLAWYKNFGEKRLTLHRWPFVYVQGLGLSEKDTKKLFKHFDEDNSGEIDFSEFRRFLLGGREDTGLQVTIAAKAFGPFEKQHRYSHLFRELDPIFIH